MASDQDTTIAVLKKRVKKFVDDRDWAKYHNPKDVAVSITIEAAELVEIFQWVKDSEQDKITQDSAKMQKLKDELADVMIYLRQPGQCSGHRYWASRVTEDS